MVLPEPFGPMSRLVAVDGHVEAAHRAQHVLQPGHDLPHQLGEAEREDDEIDTGDAQRRQADDRCERGTGKAGRGDQDRIGHEIDASRHRVHADAEERRRRQRDIVRRSGEQQPRCGERRIHRDRDRELQRIAAQDQRHQAGGYEDQGADQQVAPLAGGNACPGARNLRHLDRVHAVRLPNSPSGRTNRTTMNRM